MVAQTKIRISLPINIANQLFNEATREKIPIDELLIYYLKLGLQTEGRLPKEEPHVADQTHVRLP